MIERKKKEEPVGIYLNGNNKWTLEKWKSNQIKGQREEEKEEEKEEGKKEEGKKEKKECCNDPRGRRGEEEEEEYLLNATIQPPVVQFHPVWKRPGKSILISIN